MFECPGCCSDGSSPYYGKCLYDEVYLRTCDASDSSTEHRAAVLEPIPEDDATVKDFICPCVPPFMAVV